MGKCPVCDNGLKMEHYLALVDDSGMAEMESYCPNGCYKTKYAYGTYVEVIGNKTWEFDGTETKDEKIQRIKERKRAIAKKKGQT